MLTYFSKLHFLLIPFPQFYLKARLLIYKLTKSPKFACLGCEIKLLLACLLIVTFQYIVLSFNLSQTSLILLCVSISLLYSRALHKISKQALFFIFPLSTALLYLLSSRIYANAASIEAIRGLKQLQLSQCDEGFERSCESNTIRMNLIIRGCIDEKPERKQAGTLRLSIKGKTEEGLSSKFLLTFGDLPWKELADIKKGDCLTADARIQLVAKKHEHIPKIFSYEGYLFRKGYVGYGKAEVEDIDNSRDHTSSVIPILINDLFTQFGSSEALSATLAMTLGDSNLAGEKLWRLFRDTGLAHVLVVSGFHVGLLFMLIYNALKFGLSFWSRFIVRYPVHGPSAVFALLICVLYTLLSGWELPSVRSLFLTAMFAAGEIIGRETMNFRNLLIGFLFTQILWTASCFEPSCQLTFLALSGLLSASHFLRFLTIKNQDPIIASLKIKPRLSIQQKFLHHIFQSFVYSLLAWIWTLPAQFYWFSVFVPMSVIFNIVFAIIMSYHFVCIGGLAVFCCFCLVPFADILMHINLFIGQLIIDGTWFARNIAQRTIFAPIKLSPEQSYLGVEFSCVLIFLIIAACTAITFWECDTSSNTNSSEL